MKKNTLYDMFKTDQFKIIINCLEKYPDGLEHSELLYLLSDKKVKNQWNKEVKFKEKRKNIIPSKSRLCNCVNELKQHDLIYKHGKKYRLTKISPELKSLNDNKKILEQYFSLFRSHFSFYREDKNVDRKYSRFGLKPPNRYKKKEPEANSIIRPDIQLYGINEDVIDKDNLAKGLCFIKKGMNIIKNAHNEYLKNSGEAVLGHLKSSSSGPLDKYLKLTDAAFDMGEIDIPDKNASLEELKNWELKRVGKLIEVNLKRQKSDNITLVFNTNKDKILKQL
jgi:hypothetical protein